jgi:Tol biopolymer transport system component
VVDIRSGVKQAVAGNGRPGLTSWYSENALALAAFDDETGADQLWIVDMATGAEKRLTSVPAGIEGFPVVSSDGTWMAAALAGPGARIVMTAAPGVAH